MLVFRGVLQGMAWVNRKSYIMIVYIYTYIYFKPNYNRVKLNKISPALFKTPMFFQYPRYWKYRSIRDVSHVLFYRKMQTHGQNHLSIGVYSVQIRYLNVHACVYKSETLNCNFLYYFCNKALDKSGRPTVLPELYCLFFLLQDQKNQHETTKTCLILNGCYFFASFILETSVLNKNTWVVSITLYCCLSSWWFQPIWKNLSQIKSFPPKKRDEHKNNFETTTWL